MINSLALSILLLAFFSSIAFNGFFRAIAKKYNILIDIPDKVRRFHFRATPLTGGMGIFFGILFTGLVLTGLTDARYLINFNDKGFLENTSFNENVISKSYEVENKDYDLSINLNSNEEKISVVIDQEDSNLTKNNSTVDIIPLGTNKFKVVLPNGDEKFYISESGNITEISKDKEEIINTFTPQNTENEKVKITNFSISLYICALIILVFMIFDDLYKIKPTARLLFQIFVVSLMIVMSEEYITSFGNLIGTGEINLGIASIPITIFCVVGLMNAFNMIDGLNGICASLALIPIIFLAFLGDFSYGLLIPIGGILGFLAYNLGYLGKKRRVFLGDSGSNMLGFSVAFICIEYSQNVNHESYINPTTALWFVAIPLIDCVGVLISRAIKGIMPFRAGRDHLHHKLLQSGITPKKILLGFFSLAIFLSAIGYTLEMLYSEKEYISFFAFVVLIFLYYIFSKLKLKNNV